MQKYSYVYILTNYENTILYTGCTGKDLKARIWEHKNKVVPGFTAKYSVNKLVYYEVFEDLQTALDRERQIKAGSRRKKIALINKINPNWVDLYVSI
jgi:putative endonuclease